LGYVDWARIARLAGRRNSGIVQKDRTTDHIIIIASCETDMDVV
jgi:hypothetical protein